MLRCTQDFVKYRGSLNRAFTVGFISLWHQSGRHTCTAVGIVILVACSADVFWSKLTLIIFFAESLAAALDYHEK